MRRSPTPLRAISSPSAELGVDVGGRIGLRSAFLPHISHEPDFPSTSLGHFVGSIDAREWGSPTVRLVGDASRTVAAPQPFSEEEKI
jgi:hypothetical protein